MEMERINDNTIRVMIENTDLKERGISVMELLGDHDKIESFFIIFYLKSMLTMILVMMIR